MATTRIGYSGLQIALHWLVVAMVAVQIVIGESMTEMVDAIEEGERVSAGDAFLGNLHYWLGIGVLAAILVRLGLRLVGGAPAHAGSHSPLQNLAAAALHWTFYAALIAIPVSGILAYYGIADLGDIHALSKPLLIILVGLHVLAALYNQFVRKDGTMGRMLRPQ